MGEHQEKSSGSWKKLQFFTTSLFPGGSSVMFLTPGHPFILSICGLISPLQPYVCTFLGGYLLFSACHFVCLKSFHLFVFNVWDTNRSLKTSGSSSQGKHHRDHHLPTPNYIPGSALAKLAQSWEKGSTDQGQSTAPSSQYTHPGASDHSGLQPEDITQPHGPLQRSRLTAQGRPAASPCLWIC